MDSNVPSMFSILRPTFFVASIAGAGEAQSTTTDAEVPAAAAVAAEGNL